MGRYLNPKNQTKEEWLEANAIPLDHIPDTYKTDTHMVACLVDNGWMTACALAYNQYELEVFQYPTDPRPKLWFLVPFELTDEFK